MNSYWPHLADDSGGRGGYMPGGTGGRFELSFFRHGHSTRIGRQFVSYPYHLTRPFALDAAIPELITVYQQSSSGGLYRGERLASRFRVGQNAAVHMTTQAASLVHDCHGQPVIQTTAIDLDEGSFLAWTPEPLVLFPGGFCTTATEATIATGAVVMISEAFAWHDPTGSSRPFDRLQSDLMLRDGRGKLLLRDSFAIDGEAVLGRASSPIGPWLSVSNFVLAGDRSRLPAREQIEDLVRNDLAIGVTALPNGAGWGIRCLAADAIAARRFAESFFALSVEAAFGTPAAARRK